MQIETLKIYCDVVRFRSFSRGAEVNRVLQSAASQAIQNVEKQLGVTLIDRSCRPWTLTREGQIFYEGCREVITRYAEVEAEVKRVRASVDSVIRVAAIYSVNLRDMSQCVQRFHQLRPHARVEVEYLHPERVYERVMRDEVNIGIVSFPEARKGLAIIPWRKEVMVLACHPEHPLARRVKITLHDLAHETFVGFDTGLVIGKKIERFLKRHGVEPRFALRFDNIEAIKRAVEAGSGVAVLPQPTLQNEVRAHTLAAVPLETKEPFVRPLGIIHHRGRKIYTNTEAFIGLLQSSTSSK